MIDALEERGLVERGPDETDRRATCVSLTGRGREVPAEVNSARGAAGLQHFAVLTDTERTTLAELLAKLEHPQRAP